MTLPLGPKADLRRMADAATAQGRTTLAAACLLALSYIEQLEAELALRDAAAQAGAAARVKAQPPERRREIAVKAAHHRWCKRTASTDRITFPD